MGQDNEDETSKIKDEGETREWEGRTVCELLRKEESYLEWLYGPIYTNFLRDAKTET